MSVYGITCIRVQSVYYMQSSTLSVQCLYRLHVHKNTPLTWYIDGSMVIVTVLEPYFSFLCSVMLYTGPLWINSDML